MSSTGTELNPEHVDGKRTKKLAVTSILHDRINVSCACCSPLSLANLLKAASTRSPRIRNRYNDARFSKTSPIILDLKQISQSRSACPVCMMIFAESCKKTLANTEILLAYRGGSPECRRITVIDIFQVAGHAPVFKIYCRAEEGENPPVLAIATLLTHEIVTRVLCCSALPLPPSQSPRIRASDK